MKDIAHIKPFSLNDPKTGHLIEVKVTSRYSILSINDRHYYFKKETGEFDGTSFEMKEN
jgi:hypothetical protein